MRRKAHHKYYELNAYKSKVGWNKIASTGHILGQTKKWRIQAYYKPLNKMDTNMWMIDEAAVIQLIVWFESHYRFVNINLQCCCICSSLFLCAFFSLNSDDLKCNKNFCCFGKINFHARSTIHLMQDICEIQTTLKGMGPWKEWVHRFRWMMKTEKRCEFQLIIFVHNCAAFSIC